LGTAEIQPRPDGGTCGPWKYDPRLR